jgi:hypothetical protein
MLATRRRTVPAAASLLAAALLAPAASGAEAPAPHEGQAVDVASTPVSTVPAAPPPAAAPLPAEPPRADRGSPATFTGAPGRGITVATEDGRLSLNLRGRIQVRDTASFQPRPTTNELNVKTVRLVFSGHTLTPDVRYNLQLALGGNDFEAGSSSPIFDAWVEYTGLRDLNVRVGQFFVPFDRARTIREFALQLVDRPQVIGELTLDRDVGLSFSSADLLGQGGRLAYNLGVFGGEGRSRFGGTRQGLLYVGRLALRPFGAFDDDVEGDLQRLDRPRLALGVAGAYNQRTTRQRSTTGSALALGGVDYGHAAADAVFKYAGLSVLAEAVWRGSPTAFREGEAGGAAGGAPVREWTRSGWGYVLQAGYMVTGAVEVVGRWDQLRAGGETDPALLRLAHQQGREVGAGANVYLNGHALKLQGDWAFLFGRDPTQGRHAVRLQLDASF